MSQKSHARRVGRTGGTAARALLAAILLETAGCATMPSGRRAERPLAFDELARADRRYLEALARETWDSIDYMVHAPTQLPYDSTAKKASGNGFTSVSNIGLYVADIVAAHQLGYLGRQDALDRIAVLMGSLRQFRNWKGWTQSWNDVLTLAPNGYDRWISVLDTGNLLAGLITARSAFPEKAGPITEFVEGMDWEWMVVPREKKVRFGFNTKTLEEGGAMGDMGSDNRLAAFFAVATGALEPDAWEALGRSLEERYGIHYLAPGWQGGGLFMPFIGGIFLDDAGTLAGRAQANFAYAQMVHARQIGSPVWGWSASDSPEQGYLGMNRIVDEVVTPHASVLALHYYPRRVLANLRALEALGARDPCEIGGVPMRFGFRDAVDTRTGRTTANYLVLDQSMLFLSLANYITDGGVRDAFQADPLVRRGRERASDYVHARSLGEEEILARRDAEPAPQAVIHLDLGAASSGYRSYTGLSQREMPAPRAAGAVSIDGSADEWTSVPGVKMTAAGFLESGVATDAEDPGAWFGCMWDDDFLFFYAEVRDRDIENGFGGADLWRGDCMELYLDPAHDGFEWGNARDYQIGLAPGRGREAQTWAWFQATNASDAVRAAVLRLPDGYALEAGIRWEFLGVTASPGLLVGFSPALHDLDPSGRECKLNWSYQLDGMHLGKLWLVSGPAGG